MDNGDLVMFLSMPRMRNVPLIECVAFMKSKFCHVAFYSHTAQARLLNLWFDYNIVMLVNKPTKSRNNCFTYATEGIGSSYLEQYKQVNSIWVKFTRQQLFSSGHKNGSGNDKENEGQGRADANMNGGAKTTNVSGLTDTTMNGPTDTTTNGPTDMTTNGPTDTTTNGPTDTTTNVSGPTDTTMNGSGPTDTTMNENGPTHPQPVMSNVSKKTGKRKRCGQCSGCQQKKCGECKFCCTPKLKKVCVRRRCLAIIQR